MKIELIAPYSNDLGPNLNNVEYVKFLLGPDTPVFPVLPALPTLAALTPSEYDVKITDENIERIDYDRNVDLVGISFFTHMAVRAYAIADEYRKRGVKVILGGIHATALPDEAIQHADAVVIGEAEDTWPKLLKDFSENKLEKIYKSDGYPQLSRSPIPRWDLTNNNKYLINILQTTRGCPYDCEFCSVKSFYGASYRYKEEEQVYNEIKKVLELSPKKPILLCDDNFIGNKARAKRILRKIIPLNGSYTTQATIELAKDKELLDLMAECNFLKVFIGFESLSRKNIKEMGKKNILDPDTYFEAIDIIQSHGILVIGSFIFGLDYDTPETIEDTVEFINKSNLIKLIINVLTPYPGTKYYYRLEKENRLLTRDWAKYNSYETVIKHPNFQPGELDKLYQQALNEIYSFENIFKRIHSVYESWNKSGIKSNRIEPIVDNLGLHFFAKELEKKLI